MSLPLLDILQFLLEAQSQAGSNPEYEEKVNNLKLNLQQSIGANFGEYKIIRLANDWNPANFRKIWIPGALNYVFGFTVEDGISPLVTFHAKSKFDSGIIPAQYIDGTIELKTSEDIIFSQYYNNGTTQGAQKDSFVSAFGLVLNNYNTDAGELFRFIANEYAESTNYNPTFLGVINLDSYPDLKNFDVITSPSIEYSPGHIEESPFTGISSNLTSLNDAVTDIFSEVSRIDSRIYKLISSPIDENNLLDNLYGKRIFSKDFYFLSNISEVEGLEEKLNLFDNKFAETIQTITANQNTGLVVDNTNNRNPVIIQNNPPNYYNKTAIDNLFLGLKDNVATEGNTLNKLYNLILDRINYNEIIDSLTDTSINKALSANQGKVLKDLIDGIQTLLNSNDVNLDSLQELVDYIKNNKDLIDGITTNKLNISDIVDNLTDTSINKALSANQGKVLKDLIDSININVNNSIPIGAIIPWNRHQLSGILSLPVNFIDLNGSEINDIDSPFHGLCVPNLNGAVLNSIPISTIDNVNKLVYLNSKYIWALNVGDTITLNGTTAINTIIRFVDRTSFYIEIGDVTQWDKVLSIFNLTIEDISLTSSITVYGQKRFLRGGDNSNGISDINKGQGHKHKFKSSLMNNGDYASNYGFSALVNTIEYDVISDPVDDGQNGAVRTGAKFQPDFFEFPLVMRYK